MVGVALEGERCRGVAGEGLKIPDGLAALGEQAQAAMMQVMESDRRQPRPLQE